MSAREEFDAETEAACWAAHERIAAAFAGTDVDEQLAAIGHAWDVWLAAGIISTDEIRAAGLPHLRDAFAVLIELDPEVADELASIAVDRMDARYGIADAGWNALLINAYSCAREDLGLDRLMTPEFKASLVRLGRGIVARTDLATMLLHRYAGARFSIAQNDHAEAWSASRGARREAQDILELLGDPIDTYEYGYLQRQLPQGGAE